MNEYREWAKKHNICINCFKEKAWNGRLQCPECLEKTKIKSELTRSKASKEQKKLYLKRKREICIAFGICRECLKRPVSIGLKCLECHVKEVKRRNKNKDIPRSIRSELGLCYFCGSKAMLGKNVCKKHYIILINNIKKTNNKDHIWRKYTKIEIEEIKNKKAAK